MHSQQNSAICLCKTRGQRVHTTWQNYVGTFPHILWKAVGKEPDTHASVNKDCLSPLFPQASYTTLSTWLKHFSHLFRRRFPTVSTAPTITTTTYINNIERSTV